MKFQDWNAVEAEARTVMLASVEPFDAKTIENAQDLFAACRTRYPLPDGIGKGYWSTLLLWWATFELEVFEDRVEVYRFHHRSTEIWEEQHKPGENFSDHFLNELSRWTRPSIPQTND